MMVLTLKGVKDNNEPFICEAKLTLDVQTPEDYFSACHMLIESMEKAMFGEGSFEQSQRLLKLYLDRLDMIEKLQKEIDEGESNSTDG